VIDALVRKAYVERSPDLDDRRAVSLRVTRSGRRLYDRINQDLIAQQAALLEDLDPRLRAGVTDVIRRLAKAAQARFRADGTACGIAGDDDCCG
jgi:DNA-binding MarR family transcriptional regulator